MSLVMVLAMHLSIPTSMQEAHRLLFCQRQAGIERTRRLDTGFLNKSAVGEERGRHSGPPYHQHADSGHQCGTQPRKTHRAPARVITRHARPDR